MKEMRALFGIMLGVFFGSYSLLGYVCGHADNRSTYGGERRAWMLTVSDANSYEGRVVLPVALERLCANTGDGGHPVLVFYEKGDMNSTLMVNRCRKESPGRVVRVIRRQEAVRICPSMHDKYNGTYLRFEAWNMEEYDKIVYIDIDVIVWSPRFQGIFDAPISKGQIGAVYFHRARNLVTWLCNAAISKIFLPREWCLKQHFYTHGQLINAGVMVIRPCLETYAGILRHHDAIRRVLGEDACFHDQPVLDSFFFGNVVWLDRRFNSAPRAHCGRFSTDKDAFAIHFLGENKPWLMKNATLPGIGATANTVCSHMTAMHASKLY